MPRWLQCPLRNATRAFYYLVTQNFHFRIVYSKLLPRWFKCVLNLFIQRSEHLRIRIQFFSHFAAAFCGDKFDASLSPVMMCQKISAFLRLCNALFQIIVEAGEAFYSA